jgi:hypothetical protein
MFANAWLRIYLPWTSAVLSGLLRTRGGSYIRWVSGVRFVTKLVDSPPGRDPALPLKQEGAPICDRGAAEGGVLMRQGVLRGREAMRPGRSGRWGVSLEGMVWSRSWLLPTQSGSTVWCLGARHRLALRRPMPDASVRLIRATPDLTAEVTRAATRRMPYLRAPSGTIQYPPGNVSGTWHRTGTRAAVGPTGPATP